MRIGFIGDIVGKVGRQQVARYAKVAKKTHKLDLIAANAENASHGFGLGLSAYNELKASGVDIFSGGNHTWDKKEILPLLKDAESGVLRPHNYPQGVVGSGIFKGCVNGEEFAFINLMGHFGMPQCDNAFICAKNSVESLREAGIKNIFIDFHAEATSEKRALFMMLKGKVGAIFGTHTHVGTDDLEIFKGTFGVSDVGLSGARESVIGMDEKEPIERFLTGISSRLNVPDGAKIPTIFQMIICEVSGGECVEAYKLRAIDGGELKETLRAV
ncbi:MAG: TIGR00282 family metallophosphoesterase [Helicobacter sp.]|nr:TIGR00282 family metallophosphoesterase [Helicobacteraceae bacterium]MDY3114206.1 TIGR00282 family metallophosphoesterase [Helicobacter sp.]